MTPKQIQEAPTKDLVALYNKLTGKSISKFENRRIAEARTEEAVNEAGKMVVATVRNEQLPERGLSAATSSATRSQPRSTGLPGPHSMYAGKRLYKTSDNNPRREGTHGWTSFDRLKSGMTYEEYRLAGGRSNDLAWDIKHGYVEVK